MHSFLKSLVLLIASLISGAVMYSIPCPRHWHCHAFLPEVGITVMILFHTGAVMRHAFLSALLPPPCIPFLVAHIIMHSFPRSWHRHAFLAYILYAAKPTFQTYPALSSITFLHMRFRHAFLSYAAGTIIHSLPIRGGCCHAFLSSVSGTLSCIPLLRIRYTVMHSSPPYPEHCHAFLSSVSGTLSCIHLLRIRYTVMHSSLCL